MNRIIRHLTLCLAIGPICVLGEERAITIPSVALPDSLTHSAVLSTASEIVKADPGAKLPPGMEGGFYLSGEKITEKVTVSIPDLRFEGSIEPVVYFKSHKIAGGDDLTVKGLYSPQVNNGFVSFILKTEACWERLMRGTKASGQV